MKALFLSLIAALLTLPIAARPKPSAILTPEQKVFGLSKFWQEINYNFVYFDRVDRRAWDSTYLALIPAVQQTRDDWEYFRLLQRFCAMLDDGHTGILSPPQSSYEQTAPRRDGEVFLPIRNGLFEQGSLYIEPIEGRILVTGVNKTLGLQLPLLSQIVEVDGLPVEEYMRQYTLPYVCQSTPYMRRRRSVMGIVQGRICGERLVLRVRKPDGEMAEVALTFGGTSFEFAEGYDELPEPESSGELIDLKWYGGTAYVAQSLL